MKHLVYNRCPLNAALLGENSRQLGFSSLLLISGPSLVISPHPLLSFFHNLILPNTLV